MEVTTFSSMGYIRTETAAMLQTIALACFFDDGRHYNGSCGCDEDVGGSAMEAVAHKSSAYVGMLR